MTHLMTNPRTQPAKFVVRVFVVLLFMLNAGVSLAALWGPPPGGPGGPGGAGGHKGALVPGRGGGESDSRREERVERERSRRDGAFTDEERRALRRDLDKANRELYQR